MADNILVMNPNAFLAGYGMKDATQTEVVEDGNTVYVITGSSFEFKITPAIGKIAFKGSIPSGFSRIDLILASDLYPPIENFYSRYLQGRTIAMYRNAIQNYGNTLRFVLYTNPGGTNGTTDNPAKVNVSDTNVTAWNLGFVLGSGIPNEIEGYPYLYVLDSSSSTIPAGQWSPPRLLYNITLPAGSWESNATQAYAKTEVVIKYTGAGEIKNLNVIKVEGLTVVPVTEDGENQWKFEMPVGDVGITATEEIYYPITITANDGGTTSLSVTRAQEGDTVTFTATPNRGYYVYDVWANDTTVNQNAFGTYSFIMPNVAVGIHVVFAEANSANIVIEPQNGGIIRANPMTAYEGEKVSLSVITKEGYTFQGVTVTRGNRLVDTTKISDTEYEFTVSNLNSN